MEPGIAFFRNPSLQNLLCSVSYRFLAFLLSSNSPQPFKQLQSLYHITSRFSLIMRFSVALLGSQLLIAGTIFANPIPEIATDTGMSFAMLPSLRFHERPRFPLIRQSSHPCELQPLLPPLRVVMNWVPH